MPDPLGKKSLKDRQGQSLIHTTEEQGQQQYVRSNAKYEESKLERLSLINP